MAVRGSTLTAHRRTTRTQPSLILAPSSPPILINSSTHSSNDAPRCPLLCTVMSYRTHIAAKAERQGSRRTGERAHPRRPFSKLTLQNSHHAGSQGRGRERKGCETGSRERGKGGREVGARSVRNHGTSRTPLSRVLTGG